MLYWLNKIALKKIATLVISIVIIIILVVLFYIGKNGNLQSEGTQNGTQPNSQIINEESNNPIESKSTTDTKISLPEKTNSKESLQNNEQIIIVNDPLTAEQENAVLTYTPFNNENYNSFPDLDKSSDLIFLEKSGVLYYAGSDVSYLSQFKFKEKFYWFYTLLNTDGSQELFLSEPNFFNPRSIESIPPFYVKLITKIDENGVYEIEQLDGNGESEVLKYKIDVTKAIDNLKAEIKI